MRLTAARMVALPWSWTGPTEERDEHGNTWWEARIEELPDFMVAGESAQEVIAEAGSALEAFLASYVDRGEIPPLPLGVTAETIESHSPELKVQAA